MGRSSKNNDFPGDTTQKNDKIQNRAKNDRPKIKRSKKSENDKKTSKKRKIDPISQIGQKLKTSHSKR